MDPFGVSREEKEVASQINNSKEWLNKRGLSAEWIMTSYLFLLWLNPPDMQLFF